MTTQVKYVGHVTVTYMDYMDAVTGKTLVAVPGKTYKINLASGRTGDPETVPHGFILSKPEPIRRGVAKPSTLTPEVKE